MASKSFLKSKVFLVSGAVILVMFSLGLIYGIILFNKKHSDISKVKPEFTMKASDLYSAFENDETVSTARFSGKVVEVTGRVASVGQSPADSTISITLREDDEMSGVICTFGNTPDQVLKSVKTGDTIIVRGECSGMLMDVLLNKCVLIGSNK